MSKYEYSLKLISGPAIEPIEIADFLANGEWFKSHSMPQETQDYLTVSCIPTARERMEKHLNRKFITQTWEISIDDLSYDIRLPFGNLQSVTSVYVIGDDDTETLQSAGKYHVRTGDGGGLWLRSASSWTTTSRIKDMLRVRFVCGYGDNKTDVPAGIRLGLLKYVRTIYEDYYQDITREIMKIVREYWIPAA